MKHARPTAPRPGPICSPQALADARHLLTHAHTMADRDPPSLKDEIKAAWKLLHADRAPAAPKPPKAGSTAQILRPALEVFQAGPSLLRRHPRHRITLGPTTTPGDAA